jgi:uncharacterized lipoprotein YmbA
VGCRGLIITLIALQCWSIAKKAYQKKNNNKLTKVISEALTIELSRLDTAWIIVHLVYCTKPRVCVASVGDINNMTEEALITQNAEIFGSWTLLAAELGPQDCDIHGADLRRQTRRGYDAVSRILSFDSVFIVNYRFG